MSTALASRPNAREAVDEFLGEGHCATCRLDSVIWRRAKRGRHLIHDGGKKSCKFPCRACEHIDCAVARGETL